MEKWPVFDINGRSWMKFTDDFLPRDIPPDGHTLRPVNFRRESHRNIPKVQVYEEKNVYKILP